MTQEGDCHIAGVDGTAAELRVNFLNPGGAKTGKLLPTGKVLDELDIPGYGKIEATILDVSNPMVLVRAQDVGLKVTETPEEINNNKEASALLEKIRGTGAVIMGFAKDLEDATANSPAVPKVGFFTAPVAFDDIEGGHLEPEDMDICARVISVFKCHKACPLTSASSISVAARLEGSLLRKELGKIGDGTTVRIGHPSGVMTMIPSFEGKVEEMKLTGVAVQLCLRAFLQTFLRTVRSVTFLLRVHS